MRGLGFAYDLISACGLGFLLMLLEMWDQEFTEGLGGGSGLRKP